MRSFILFILLIAAFPVVAQQDDEQQGQNYVFEDYGIAFTYPEDWTVMQEDLGMVLVGNEDYQLLVIADSELALVSFNDTRLDSVLGSYFNYIAVNIPYDPSLIQEGVFDEESEVPRDVMVYAYDDDKSDPGIAVTFPFDEEQPVRIGLMHLMVQDEELEMEDYDQLKAIAETYRPAPRHVIPGSAAINLQYRDVVSCTLYASKAGMDVYDTPDGNVIATVTDTALTFDAVELITLDSGEEWYSIDPASFDTVEAWVSTNVIDPASNCLDG